MSTSDFFETTIHNFNLLHQSAESWWWTTRRFSGHASKRQVKSRIWLLMSWITVQDRRITCGAYFFLKFIAPITPIFRYRTVMKNVLKVDLACSRFNFTSKNCIKHLWHFFLLFLTLIFFINLTLTSWQTNLSDGVIFDASLVSSAYFPVDGTDCRIAESTLFSLKWYWHRF